MTSTAASTDHASAAGQGVRTRTTAPSSSETSVLLVDDNPEIARALALAFDCAGLRLVAAASPAEAFATLARTRFDAILLDLNFGQGQTSGEEGFACLRRIVADDPDAAVVVITAHSGLRLAIAAMQAGALDFVMKPWRNADLVSRVEAAAAKRRRTATRPAAGAPASPLALHRLIGDSAAMGAVRNLIRRVSPTPVPVLVTGPAGSGRTLAASLLHAGSRVAAASYATIDLRDAAEWHRLDVSASLPAGDENTGTPPRTLVLRHPDLLDAVAQDRLADRLPAASRLLAIAADAAALTPRLRARLCTVEIALPPLVARDGDALLLARHFAALAGDRLGRAPPPFTASAEQLVLTRIWPGEVRGLAQAVDRAVLLDDQGVIDAAALLPVAPAITAPAAPAAAPTLEDAERVMIEQALRRHRHNVSQAAAELGLSRQALYRRMERYGL